MKKEEQSKIGFLAGNASQSADKTKKINRSLDSFPLPGDSEKSNRKTIYVKEEFVETFEAAQKLGSAYNVSISEIVGYALDAFHASRTPTIITKFENKKETVSFYGRLLSYIYIDSTALDDGLISNIDLAYQLFWSSKGKFILHVVEFPKPLSLLQLVIHSAAHSEKGYPINLCLQNVINQAKFSDYGVFEEEIKKVFVGEKTEKEVKVHDLAVTFFECLLEKKLVKKNTREFLDL